MMEQAKKMLCFFLKIVTIYLLSLVLENISMVFILQLLNPNGCNIAYKQARIFTKAFPLDFL